MLRVQVENLTSLVVNNAKYNLVASGKGRAEGNSPLRLHRRTVIVSKLYTYIKLVPSRCHNAGLHCVTFLPRARLDFAAIQVLTISYRTDGQRLPLGSCTATIPCANGGFLDMSGEISKRFSLSGKVWLYPRQSDARY